MRRELAVGGLHGISATDADLARFFEYSGIDEFARIHEDRERTKNNGYFGLERMRKFPPNEESKFALHMLKAENYYGRAMSLGNDYKRTDSEFLQNVALEHFSPEVICLRFFKLVVNNIFVLRVVF